MNRLLAEVIVVLLAILAIIALSIWFSHMDFKTVVPKKVEGKPLEEIMHPNAPIPQSEESWDKDFKSAIQPVSRKK